MKIDFIYLPLKPNIRLQSGRLKNNQTKLELGSTLL